LTPWVDHALVFEALTHLLKLSKNSAQAWADIEGLDGDAGPCCPEIQLADNGDAITVCGAVAQLSQS
jgi:hypothetical protein